MIDHETELRLQAYVDGELSPGEASAIRELTLTDSQARALCETLRAVRSTVAGNEPEKTLSGSREFYWGGILRRIEFEEQRASAGRVEEAEAPWWLRFLAPAGVLAALAVFVALSLRGPDDPSKLWALEDGHEIETPLEETSSFSFRSESAAMTVVWVDSHRE